MKNKERINSDTVKILRAVNPKFSAVDFKLFISRV